MKRTRNKKNAPSGLERGVLEALRQLRDQVLRTPYRVVTENDVLIFMAGRPGRQGHPAGVRAALGRLEMRGFVTRVGDKVMFVDRAAKSARDRTQMVQALAAKHGGVLFESDVWCFLGAAGADAFTAAVKLEGLEVKRWRDDLADKAQVIEV